MTVLVAVGVAVIVLGAVVLLLFPDRPGGRIAWQGAEVSSIGAGLPLIVVGIVAVALASSGAVGGGANAETHGAGDRPGSAESAGGDATTQSAGGTNSASGRCTPTSNGVRVVDVPQGADALIVAGANEPKSKPFTLHFTDGGKWIGDLTARLLPSQAFAVESFFDGNCNSDVVENAEGQPIDAIPNSTNVRIPTLLGHSYVLNLGYNGSDIRVNFVSAALP